MLTLDPEALALLRYRTLDDDPESLALALYGPSWREAVRPTETGWKTTRSPLPAFAADFLAEILDGAVAHDGRSTRESRSSGWWLRTPSGDWRPTSLDSLSHGLHRVVLALMTEAGDNLAAAIERARKARADHVDVKSPGSARALDTADRASRSEALRTALLSGLSVLVAGMGRNVGATFAALRDRLPIPAEALLAIAERWLDDALLVGDVTPTLAGRISVAEVRDAYERQARSGDVLPLQTLYRSLDVLLGARVRRVEWNLPDTSREEIPA